MIRDRAVFSFGTEGMRGDQQIAVILILSLTP